MYQQLIQPDLTIVGIIGFCLNYAGRVFGISSGPATAFIAWQQTKFPHTDQNFPMGVSFPVWFSGAEGAGHVAVHTPNGIYSSPYNQKTGHNVLVSIADVEKNYGVKYLGWSEDIEGKQVIKGVTVPNITPLTHDEVNFAYLMVNQPSNINDWNYYANKPGELIDNLWNAYGKAQYEAASKPPVPTTPTDYKPYDGPPLFVEKG